MARGKVHPSWRDGSTHVSTRSGCTHVQGPRLAVSALFANAELRPESGQHWLSLRRHFPSAGRSRARPHSHRPVLQQSLSARLLPDQALAPHVLFGGGGACSIAFMAALPFLLFQQLLCVRPACHMVLGEPRKLQALSCSPSGAFGDVHGGLPRHGC